MGDIQTVIFLCVYSTIIIQIVYNRVAVVVVVDHISNIFCDKKSIP